ncbi:MAG: hypothetical protein DRJ10_10160, partial [Bacteroidetes bacterium]
AFEQAYGMLLPKTYKQFLKKYNGGMITRYSWTSYIDMTEYESEHPTRDSFKMFGYDEVVKNYTDLRLNDWMMPEDFNGNYPIIPICKMPESEGEYLYIFSEKGLTVESPVFAFLGDDYDEPCTIIADNFNDFLGLLMEHEGFPPVTKESKKKTYNSFIEQNKIVENASAEETDEEIIIRNTAYLQLFPENGWSYNERGIAHRDIGQRQLALDDFNKSIELNNKESFFYYCRGDLVLDYGSLRKALIDYDIAVKLEPDNKLYISGRADALQKLGKLKKALADCNKVLDEDSHYTLALYVRERIYKAMGEEVLAQADLDLIDELK